MPYIGAGTQRFNTADGLTVSGDASVSGTTALTGNATAAGTLDVTGAITSSAGATITTADNTTQLTLKSTDADSSTGPVLDLVRDSASPADGDAIGKIAYIADNDAGEATTYSSAFTTLRDASDGAEDGQVINYVMTNGSLVDHLRMGRGSAGGQSEVVINEGSADIDFRVESNGQSDMLFVDAGNDRVGIGTNAPVNTLDIIDNGGGAAVVGRIRNEGGAAGDDATLELSIATASEEMRILFTDSSGTAGQIVVDGGDNSMAFETGTSEAMRIDSSGDVLIGTTSFTSGGGGIKLGAATATREFSADNTGARQQIGFHNPNGEVGSIFTSGSATTFSTSSDYRLKENVVALSNAITRVKTLAPKRFNFIADANTTFDGFLAHEAQAVVPEAVIGTHNEVETWTQQQIDDGDAPDGTSAGDNKLDDDGNTIPVMQGIDHSKLVPLLTGALQEAITKIETLETEMTALKARVTALEDA